MEKCCIEGCNKEGIESFGDIERKLLYCHEHSSLIEMMADAEENMVLEE
jgi:hypothetical protein